MSYEEDFSTQPDQASSSSWFSRPHGNRQRPQGLETPPRPRPQGLDREGRRQVSRRPCDRSSSCALFSLSRDHRLHYRWEFRRFFNQSEVFRLSACTVFRVQNERGHFRLGITLKARGSSVERNRVKRAVRENFRKLGPRLGSFDYNVVIPGSRRMAFPYPQRLALAIRDELGKAVLP